MGIVELGYIGLEVSDLAAWRRFATEVAGFQYADGDRPGTARLRMDYWHQRIVLHEGAADDLAYFGLRVADEQALAEICERLHQAGYPYKTGSDQEADERHVMGLIRVVSPGGLQVEIFWGPQVDYHSPFHPGRPLHGRFRTGSRGLGHIAIREPREEALDFYRLLGFKGGAEYKLQIGPIRALPIFMSCNERQHTLQFDLGPLPKRIHHIMIEYEHFDDVGLAHDIVRKRGLDIGMDIGKHANDHAHSFYVGAPSKFLIELGCEVRDTPAYAEYSTTDIYGHVVGAKGYGLDALNIDGE